jgi:hypothetical protein
MMRRRFYWRPIIGGDHLAAYEYDERAFAARDERWPVRRAVVVGQPTPFGRTPVFEDGTVVPEGKLLTVLNDLEAALWRQAA